MADKKKAPRKHHYLPQFYLAGFTPSGKKDDYVWVLDQTSYEHKRRKVEEVAHRRDYYSTIREAEIDASLEIMLGAVEDKAAPILEAIKENGTLPEGEDLGLFTFFLALMIVRVPSTRAMLLAIERMMIDALMRKLSTKEGLASTVEEMKEAGVDILAGISFEELLNFNASGEYSIRIGKNSELGSMVQLAMDIFPHLINRKWCVMRVPAGEGEFICSDNPVRASFTKQMPVEVNPGLAEPDNAILFPVSKNVLLVSWFGGASNHWTVDRDLVARANSLIGTESGRWLYSASKEIFWMKEDKSIGNTDELIEMLRYVNLAGKLRKVYGGGC